MNLQFDAFKSKIDLAFADVEIQHQKRQEVVGQSLQQLQQGVSESAIQNKSQSDLASFKEDVLSHVVSIQKLDSIRSIDFQSRQKAQLSSSKSPKIQLLKTVIFPTYESQQLFKIKNEICEQISIFNQIPSNARKILQSRTLRMMYRMISESNGSSPLVYQLDPFVQLSQKKKDHMLKALYRQYLYKDISQEIQNHLDGKSIQTCVQVLSQISNGQEVVLSSAKIVKDNQIIDIVPDSVIDIELVPEEDKNEVIIQQEIDDYFGNRYGGQIEDLFDVPLQQLVGCVPQVEESISDRENQLVPFPVGLNPDQKIKAYISELIYLLNQQQEPAQMGGAIDKKILKNPFISKSPSIQPFFDIFSRKQGSYQSKNEDGEVRGQAKNRKMLPRNYISKLSIVDGDLVVDNPCKARLMHMKQINRCTFADFHFSDKVGIALISRSLQVSIADLAMSYVLTHCTELYNGLQVSCSCDLSKLVYRSNDYVFPSTKDEINLFTDYVDRFTNISKVLLFSSLFVKRRYEDANNNMILYARSTIFTNLQDEMQGLYGRGQPVDPLHTWVKYFPRMVQLMFELPTNLHAKQQYTISKTYSREANKLLNLCLPQQVMVVQRDDDTTVHFPCLEQFIKDYYFPKKETVYSDLPCILALSCEDIDLQRKMMPEMKIIADLTNARCGDFTSLPTSDGEFYYVDHNDAFYVDQADNLCIRNPNSSNFYCDEDFLIGDVTISQFLDKVFSENDQARAVTVYYAVNTHFMISDWLVNFQNLAEALIASNSSHPVISFLCNDVHYYLSDIKLDYNVTMYISGADFFPLPGQYTLPLGEGSYTVTCDKDFNGKLVMNTSGNSQIYSHPFVVVPDQTSRLDYGWYAHFQKIFQYTAGDSMPFYRIKIPYIETLKSIQSTFVVQKIEQLQLASKSQTMSNILTQHKPFAYTDGQINQMLTKGFSSFSKPHTTKQRFKDFFVRKQGQAISLQDWKLWLSALNYNTAIAASYSKSTNYLGIYKRIDECKYSHVEKDIHTKHDFFEGAFFQKKRLEETDGGIYADQILIAGAQDISEAHKFDTTRMIKQKDMIYEYNQWIKKNKGKIPDLSHSKLINIDSLSIPQEYYFSKPITEIPTLNPLLFPTEQDMIDGTFSMAQIEEWVVRHPDAICYRSGKFYPVDTKAPTLNCGFKIDDGGKTMQSYEWSSKSIQNSISAFLNRQINSQTRICNKKLERFKLISSIYIDSIVCKMESDNILISQLKTFDPFAWLDTKDTFDSGKKQKYFQTLTKQMTSSTPIFISSFKTMVKSGEVQYETDLQIENGFLKGVSGRPRNISVPSASTCGFLTAVQSLLFPSIQRQDESFVQGTTKEQLTDRFKRIFRRLSPSKSISIDGSSFDSTQYEVLQKCVDVCFWNRLKPLFDAYLLIDSSYKPVDRLNFIERLISAATRTDYDLFFYCPNEQDHVWSKKAERIFRRDWPNDRTDFKKRYLYFNIHGTTFSGHPTSTTLCNTLRSICYILFYADAAGISPDQIRFLVSGDDVVIYTLDALVQKLVDAILANTHRRNCNETIALGQVVKEVKVSEWYDIEFCSKWSFMKNGYEDFYLTRDCQRTLNTRQFYNGDVKDFFREPDLYVQAMLLGLESEHISVLLEDFYRIRLSKPYRDYKQDEKTQSILKQKIGKYKFEEIEDHSRDYFYESQINSRLGISVGVLLRALSTGTINICGNVHEKEYLISNTLLFRRVKQKKAPRKYILRKRIQKVKNFSSLQVVLKTPYQIGLKFRYSSYPSKNCLGALTCVDQH